MAGKPSMAMPCDVPVLVPDGRHQHNFATTCITSRIIQIQQAACGCGEAHVDIYFCHSVNVVAGHTTPSHWQG